MIRFAVLLPEDIARSITSSKGDGLEARVIPPGSAAPETYGFEPTVAGTVWLSLKLIGDIALKKAIDLLLEEVGRRRSDDIDNADRTPMEVRFPDGTSVTVAFGEPVDVRALEESIRDHGSSSH